MSSTDTTDRSIAPDREALSLMTKLKLDRFKLRKIKFVEEYTQIMTRINDSTMSSFDKVQLVSKSIENLFGGEGKTRYLKNLETILTISKANTSTTNDFLENFFQNLMKTIEGGKRRSEYNYLFGLIMSQWLSNQQDEFTPIEVTSNDESLLTNEQLKAIIFDKPQLDLDKWRYFLEKNLLSKKAFEKLNLATEKFSKSLLMEKVSSADVQRAIDGVINGGSLDDYRKRLLMKMRLEKNTLDEFASSLNLMIADLADWNWPIEGVRGVFRRNLVGKYRCYYEENFLTAIFLEHIGLKWSYHFRDELELIFEFLTEKLEKNCSSNSIQDERINMQKDQYWMSALPDESHNESGMASYANVDSVDLKAKLLYLINVEIQLHQVLHPDTSFTVVSADLEWFGPSIPHEIILIFLEFCGVSQIWLNFFDRFLKQPIYYKPGESIRQRQRGVPIAHSISFLFSELMLSGMDLYVYQNTGIFNYRFHDDFWFFDSQSDKVTQAWTLMNEYAQITGLKFNEEKCGSVQILPSNITNQTDTLLPHRNVKWGLLTLQSTGRFVIHRETIIPFLDEMKVRLTNALTITEWINLYNQYIAFFMRNFGKCANILGIYHTQQMIETFQFIHQYVFSETNGNVLTILMNCIAKQFPDCMMNELCEAWFYWPIIHGGLNLKNIYLDLYSIHNQLLNKKMTTFDQLPERDIEKYAEIMEKYERGKIHRKNKSFKKYLHDDETLISFDEFIQRRESRISYWNDVYKEMLNTTPSLSPIMTDHHKDHIQLLQNTMTKTSSGKRYHAGTNYYLEWLVCFYSEQIESTFNQLDFIDPENVPVGLISLMQTTKINWNKE
ncbi:unnamed protein product [Adineta steineri]|uniref:Reverse transcriptase domain-containing protein n=1 Tax=Adineta steineri TaxID=433720 RepID=A0A819I830_9BILA|nr:unnamed protein product [Adineta steineri]